MGPWVERSHVADVVEPRMVALVPTGAPVVGLKLMASRLHRRMTPVTLSVKYRAQFTTSGRGEPPDLHQAISVPSGR